MKKKATEELILKSVFEVFMVKGKIHASVEELAKEAGVSRTLFNYYYRSREFLIDEVFNASSILFISLFEELYIIGDSVNFNKRHNHFIDLLEELANKYPYQGLFLSAQSNQNDIYTFRTVVGDDKYFSKFVSDVQEHHPLAKNDREAALGIILTILAQVFYPKTMQRLLQPMMTENTEHFNNVCRQILSSLRLKD